MPRSNPLDKAAKQAGACYTAIGKAGAQADKRRETARFAGRLADLRALADTLHGMILDVRDEMAEADKKPQVKITMNTKPLVAVLKGACRAIAAAR